MDCTRATARPGAGEDRPRLADVFRRHGAAYAADHHLSPGQQRVLDDILRCRTAVLGGHVYVCDKCDHKLPVYNSCLNRNCPQCQAFEQARWIAARAERLLPVGHHHVVFTLPSELRPLARRHPRQVYGALFEAASQTLDVLARDVLGARLGVTAVLHTWTRTLSYHPHLHCVVTAGGLTLDGSKWVKRKQYLFHVARMKAVFRGRLLASLQRRHEAGDIELDGKGTDPWRRLVSTLPAWRRWVVYIQPPFGRSTHVIEYLGRYTHRIGISDARLVAHDERGVTFRTHGDDTVTLDPSNFIARFLQHVLPSGFHKIRHFGLYAAAHVHRLWPVAAALLGAGDGLTEEQARRDDIASADTLTLLELLTGTDATRCPRCDVGRLHARPLPRARSP